MKGINKSAALIVVMAAAIIGMGGYIFASQVQAKEAARAAASLAAAAQPVATEQSEYVKPETPVDRSKNVTLPGWGGFTIPAEVSHITQGFEFHNPAANLWYEDWVSINGDFLEKLVVDSSNQVELNHYLKLAGIKSEVAEVTDYDSEVFRIEKNDDSADTLEAIGWFEGNKTITVKTTDGSTVELVVACKQECYYMTFGLYLSDGDELLYQSDLVSPGMYIQQMDIAHKLAPGTYDAYVVCQPYRSDRATKTNSGIVKLTLTVK